MSKLVLFILCLPLVTMAEIVTENVSWNNNQNAQELYTTPMGRVFRFTRCEGKTFLFPESLLPNTKNHQKDCNCYTCFCRRMVLDGGVLEIELPKEKKKTSNKRYLAIDFRIRAFPALSKDKFSPIAFSFRDSNNKIDGSKYQDLHGMLNLVSNSLSVLYSTTTGIINPLSTITFHPVFNPCYEPISMRIVYDTAAKTICVHMNDGVTKQKQVQSKVIAMKMRHFGIATFLKDKQREYRTEYLEVSDPVIYRFDDEEELKELPPVTFVPYSYEAYVIDSRRPIQKEEDLYPLLKRHKNPEMQYAYALRYLYGSDKMFDPKKGLELLEKAADENHVLALYQLGVCYFRGYGVKPNWTKAKSYLSKSLDYGFTDAGALLCFLKTEDHGRPWFFAKEYEKLLKRIPYREGHGTKHDPEFVRYSQGMLDQKMISPKLLLCDSVANSFIRKGQDNPKTYYVDYLMSKGIPLAWFSKETSPLHPDKDQTLRLLQTAMEKGVADAYPYQLFWRFKLGEKISPDEFTTYRDLQYADEPLYWITSLLVKNPDFPDIPYFLSNPNFTCRIPESWKKMNTPESELLIALSSMQNLRKIRYGQLNGTIKTLNETYEHLKSAAAGNNPVAQYWLGRFYYYDDLPYDIWKLERNEFSRMQTARRYFISAGRNGHPGAALLLAELEMKQFAKNLTAVIATVEPFCKINYPKAFYIKAQALLELHRDREANQVCAEGIKAGEYRCWQLLAISGDRQSKPKPDLQCWFQFVSADRQARAMDRFDPFWPSPFEDFNQWENENDPRRKEETDSDKTVRDIFQEERNETGSNTSTDNSVKTKKKKTSRR